MNSPYLGSSSSSIPRPRTDSTFSIHLHDTGGIQKRNNSRSGRPQSISIASIERHPELLPDQIQNRLNLGGDTWTTAKHEQQPQSLQTPFSPPAGRSLFRQPGAVFDQTEQQPSRQASTSTPAPTLDSRDTPPPVTSANMASLSYLPPPHYGNMAFQDPSFDQSYQQVDSHSHIHPSSNFGFLFGSSTAPSQHSIYAPGPLHMEPTFSSAPLEPSMSHVSESTMTHLNRATSPFHQPNYEGLEYPLASAPHQVPVTRSLSHSPLSSHHIGPLTPPLTAGLDSVQPQLVGSPGAQAGMDPIRSPSIYETHAYSSSYAAPAVQAPQPLYQNPPSYSYPPPQGISTRQQMGRNSTDSQVRVINQKPKPQCWEHGCNGREFSTFSNLLRHQREKSGTAAKSYCPKCGAEFTRTTARNGHLAHEKCSKQRRTSEVK